MRTTNHPLEPEELMAWLDGELPPDRAARAAEHTATCRECQATAADIRRVTERLMEWRVTAPAMAAPEAETEKVYRPVVRRRWVWALGIALPGVAVIATVLVHQVISSRVTVNASLPSQAVMSLPRLRSAEIASPGQQGGVVEFEAQNRRPGRPLNQLTAKEPAPERLIAHTARLTVIAANFDAARDALQSILNRHDSYIAQLTVNAESASARYLDASLRIPDSQLDVVIAAIRGLGRATAESRGGEEVTQQSIDLNARLANARNTEERLTELLKHRTDKLADILAVENQISETRGEIERMEAERKALTHRVEYATLDVHISEPYKAQVGEKQTSAWIDVRNAAVDGFSNLTQSIVGVITFLLADGPVVLLWCAVLFFPARYVWRRRS